jgi:hypothetical protein
MLETVMKAYVMAAMFEEASTVSATAALSRNHVHDTTERGSETCLPQNLRNSAYMAADMINALLYCHGV